MPPKVRNPAITPATTVDFGNNSVREKRCRIRLLKALFRCKRKSGLRPQPRAPTTGSVARDTRLLDTLNRVRSTTFPPHVQVVEFDTHKTQPLASRYPIATARV